MKSLSLSRPHSIVMVGIPGSGKTFFAEKFADTFNAPFVSEQVIAKLANGISHKSVQEIASQQVEQLVKTSQSIVVEAAASTLAERNAISRKFHSHGYQVLFVWVQTDIETAKQRHLKTQKTAAGAKMTSADYDKRLRRFKSPQVKDGVVVISGKHTYATQARVVLKKLSGPRANISTHSQPSVRSISDVRRNKR